MTLRRYWVNQPSALQPWHEYHGRRVLATEVLDERDRVYFISGDVVSAQAPDDALSPGWPVTSHP